jgi:transglutaminase-like putative cysteine protease
VSAPLPGGWPLRVVLLAGAAALGTTGSALAGVGALTVLGILVPPPRVRAGRWVGAHVAVIAVCAALIPVAGGVVAVAALAGWLLVHQAWQRTADTGRTAALLATLLLLAASIRTDSPLLAPLFVAWAGALPLALLRLTTWDGTPDTEREPGRDSAVVVASLAITGALFFAMPRLQGGFLGEGAASRSRFPDDLQLASSPFRGNDLAVVMRVRVTDVAGEPVPPPWHVRARVLDRFDGTRWSADETVIPPPSSREPNRLAEVALSAEPGAQLYGVGNVLRIEGAPGVHRVADGIFHHRAPGQPLRYTAFGHAASLAGIEPDPPARQLALPEGLDPRVPALAWEIAPRQAPPETVVEAVLTHLSGLAYDAERPAPQGDPLAWFLFTRRAGHCEYFAGAAATLLRARGVGARVATGFYVEDTDADGWATVRGNMAHAWVEVRTDSGWATIDPTPPSGRPDPDAGGWRARLETVVAAWYRDVVDFDTQAQFAAWGALGKPLVRATPGSPAGAFTSSIVGMGLTVAGLAATLGGVRLGLWLMALPRGRRDPFGGLAREARSRVTRAGWSWPESVPPLEAAHALQAEAPELARALACLGSALYAGRYGPGRADARAREEALRDARQALRDLRATLRRRPTPQVPDAP